MGTDRLRFARHCVHGREWAHPGQLPERSRRSVAGKGRCQETAMKKALLGLIPLALIPLTLAAQFHRAEQDREISYWLLDPGTHQFRISHDFTVSRLAQKYVHRLVRKDSKV